MKPKNKTWDEEVEEILKDLEENGDGYNETEELPEEFIQDYINKYGISNERMD